jgi:flagellar M-ring protein FliF
MDGIKQLFGGLSERYQALPATQRMLIPVLVAALLLAVGFLFFIQGQEDYGVLFTNLSQDDAGGIISKLKAKKVPYRLENNGTAIMVPKSEMYEMRLVLASEGLPKGGGVGFEIFDRQELGVTDFVQHLNYQRALQGELARTIAGMPEVLEARVHIVVPKESLFVEDQKQTTASVAVKLRPGRSLSPGQVEAVVNLVASSVSGLHTNQITVVDLKGRILSKPQQRSGFEGLSAGQLGLQRQVEESYERKVQELFDKILGPGKSFVRASSELDFQKIDLREETFTPNKDLVRSEQKTVEQTSRALEGGNPDAKFNLNQGTVTPPPPGKGPPPLTAPAPPPKTPQGSTGSERISELRNYEISRAIKQVVESPGKIKRISLAVVVDGTYPEKSNKFTPRSPEEVRQFANLAKKAVGFSSERGDQLEISCVPLASQALEGTAAFNSEEGWQKGLAFSWKIGALVLIILVILMFLLKRRRVPAQQPPLLQGPSSPQPALHGAQTNTLPTATAPLALEGGQPQAVMAALPEPVDGKERVSQLITNYPDRAVEVLRLWIHDKEAK